MLKTLFLILVASLLAWSSNPSHAAGFSDICLARWEKIPFKATANGFAWAPPHIANHLGSIDLRSTKSESLTTGGWALFSYDRPMGSTGMHCFGSDPRAPLTKSQADTIGVVLGHGLNAISGATLSDIIFELYTKNSDPTGFDHVGTMLPKGDKIQIHIGDTLIVDKTVDPNDKIFQDRQNYIDQQNSSATIGKLAAPLLAVTITDDFDCANSATLGCDLTWSELVGTAWEVLNNEARISTSGGNHPARADSDLDTSTHYAQAEIDFFNTVDTGGGMRGGPMANKASSGNYSFYSCEFDFLNNNMLLLEYDSFGSPTTHETTSQTPSGGDIVKIENNGGDLDCYVNGGLVGSGVNDTTHTNVRAGIMVTQTFWVREQQWDNFEAGDIVASTAQVIVISQMFNQWATIWGLYGQRNAQ